MKIFKTLKEDCSSKPKVVLGLALIFLILAILSSLIGFEMYLNEESLLKENFKNNEMNFYLLFMTGNGLAVFFYFLAKGLWQLKNWTRFFLIGSSFLSSLYVIYNIIILTYITFTDKEDTQTHIISLLINFIYMGIYIYIIKYFLNFKIEFYFLSKKENLEFKKENFYDSTQQ